MQTDQATNRKLLANGAGHVCRRARSDASSHRWSRAWPVRRWTAEDGTSPRDDWSRQAFDLAEIILVHLGVSREIQHLNRKGEQILGYPSAELIGKNWLETCVPLRDREQVHRVFASFIETRGDAPEQFENHILRKDGAERLIKWRNTTLRDTNGRVVADLVPLQASVQGRAGEVWDRRLQGVEAVVGRQQRVAAERDDDRLLLGREHAGAYLLGPSSRRPWSRACATSAPWWG